MKQQLQLPTGGPLIRVKRPATVTLNDESQPKEETKKRKNKHSENKTIQVNLETTWNNNNNNKQQTTNNKQQQQTNKAQYRSNYQPSIGKLM